MSPLLSWVLLSAFSLSTALALNLTSNKLYATQTYTKLLTGALNSSALSSNLYPHYTTKDSGRWEWFGLSAPNTDGKGDGWPAGFFPSMMYLLNEREGACKGLAPLADWVSLGRAWSTPLLALHTNNTIQDSIGLASLPFQDELKVNPGNDTAKTAVIDFANALAARYNPTIGALKSTDSPDSSTFTTSIEDMVNIQVLMAAYKLNTNETLKTIAETHANTTMREIVKPNGGNYRFVDFKTSDGSVADRKDSGGPSWARGQAWGMLGFSQMYQDTQDQRFLDTARNMSNYFIAAMPTTTMVVPWNLNDTSSSPPDSSAAMIASYAYALLAKLDPNSSYSTTWMTLARQILNANVDDAWKPNWQSYLTNGTVDNDAKPPNTGTGTVYGDYYFLKFGNYLLDENYFSCN